MLKFSRMKNNDLRGRSIHTTSSICATYNKFLNVASTNVKKT